MHDGSFDSHVVCVHVTQQSNLSHGHAKSKISARDQVCSVYQYSACFLRLVHKGCGRHQQVRLLESSYCEQMQLYMTYNTCVQARRPCAQETCKLNCIDFNPASNLPFIHTVGGATLHTLGMSALHTASETRHDVAPMLSDVAMLALIDEAFSHIIETLRTSFLGQAALALHIANALSRHTLCSLSYIVRMCVAASSGIGFDAVCSANRRHEGVLSSTLH